MVVQLVRILISSSFLEERNSPAFTNVPLEFAKFLIVVANLVVANEKHGLHLFVLQLRDEQGKLTPGITVVDCGQKMGI